VGCAAPLNASRKGKEKTMKKLVVGATGTVGSALIAELARREVPVIAATRDPSRQTFPSGIEAVAFDYADPVSMDRALAGVDAMFVLAPPGMEGQAERWRNLFARAVASGVHHVVLMTAKGAGDDTPHGQGEAALKASGLRWTLLRPTFFAQNFATYSGESIRRDGAFYYPAGDGRAAFVDVRDIAAVAAHVLVNPASHEGQSYELTGPQALAMGDVAEVLGRVSGRSIRYVDPGEDGYRSALESHGLSPALAGMFTYLYAVVVKNGWAAGTSDDIAKVLGRAPTTFEQFARDHAAAWVSA
jgi:uncharacterized protein YbjT (DUF2867 family)